MNNQHDQNCSSINLADNDKDYSFSNKIRNEVRLRAGIRCSNPNCRRLTDAYNPKMDRMVTIGEAAHIRDNKNRNRHVIGYPANKIENAIWLCSSCHTLIDKGENKNIYTIELLTKWKKDAESANIVCLEKPRYDFSHYTAERQINSDTFNFNEASDLQCVLFLYCFITANSIRYDYEFDEENGNEMFFSFYKNFIEWYLETKNKKIRDTFPSLILPTYTKICSQSYKDNVLILNLFNDALLKNNMSNLVSVRKGYINLEIEDICSIVFGDDEDKIDNFFKYWSDISH